MTKKNTAVSPSTEKSRGPDCVAMGAKKEVVVGEEASHVGNDDEEVSKEAQAQPMPHQCPRAPSRQERLEHCITHCAYRSWCKRCVAGKAKAMAHRASKRSEDEVPVVACDYA